MFEFNETIPPSGEIKKVVKNPTHPAHPTLDTNNNNKNSELSSVGKIMNPTQSPSLPTPKPEKEVLSQRETADLVIDMIRGSIAYNPKAMEWFKREGNIWIEVDADTINPFVIKALDKVKNKKYSFSAVTSIKNFVRDLLRIYKFESSRRLLPLQNGVYNLESNQLESYNTYQYSWELPYKHDSSAKCPSVLRYLVTATGGDRDLINFLLAWMRVIISGEYTVQKYVELVGDGGTGKSTFLELCTLLIGENNRVVTDLKSLESNRFESANLQGKRLALITDSSRYSGEVAQLKALTGGDAIRNEKKNKQAGKGFVFTGLVMIAANEAIQSSDYTSGLARRRIPIIFNARVSEKEKNRYKYGVINQMKSELSGLLNILIQIPIEDAVRLVKRPEGTLKKVQLKSELNANPILAWMNERLIKCDSGKESGIGAGYKKTDELDDRLLAENTKLYPNYMAFCEEQGRKSVSIRRFSGLVEDMARSHDIQTTKRRTNAGTIFDNLRLRGVKDKDSFLLESVEEDSKNEGKNGYSAGYVEDEGVNQSVDLQGFDDWETI